MIKKNHMRQGIAFVVFLLIAIPTSFVSAQSISFNASFPKIYEEWIRDAGKHTNHMTINGFVGNVEYGMRVVDADTGQVVPSGSTVPKGTRLKMEFLPEKMSYVIRGNVYDTPYATWTSATPPIQCQTADRIYYRSSVYKGKPRKISVFAEVYAKPPAHSIANTQVLGSCSGQDDERICTAENTGTHNVTFTWAQTTASMYVRVLEKDDTKHAPPRSRWPRYNTCVPMGPMKSRTDFAGANRNVPMSNATLAQRTIPFRVIVEEGPEIPTTPPSSPNVTAAGGACTAGEAYAISINGTDPDGDRIRYLIDWNNDGTPDAWAPNSGYIDSGTSQSASRTFATVGPHVVRVRTQDEHGALSGWASLSVTCDGSSEIGELSGENDPNLSGNGGVPNPSVNDLSLRALPSLVRTGGTTRVHWSSQSMESCSVSGSNGDSWSGLNSPVSGEISGAIDGTVLYTLTCTAGGDSFSKTATVNVLPSWVEK